MTTIKVRVGDSFVDVPAVSGPGGLLCSSPELLQRTLAKFEERQQRELAVILGDGPGKAKLHATRGGQVTARKRRRASLLARWDRVRRNRAERIETGNVRQVRGSYCGR